MAPSAARRVVSLIGKNKLGVFELLTFPPYAYKDSVYLFYLSINC